MFNFSRGFKPSHLLKHIEIGSVFQGNYGRGFIRTARIVDVTEDRFGRLKVTFETTTGATFDLEQTPDIRQMHVDGFLRDYNTWLGSSQELPSFSSSENAALPQTENALNEQETEDPSKADDMAQYEKYASDESHAHHDEETVLNAQVYEEETQNSNAPSFSDTDLASGTHLDTEADSLPPKLALSDQPLPQRSENHPFSIRVSAPTQNELGTEQRTDALNLETSPKEETKAADTGAASKAEQPPEKSDTFSKAPNSKKIAIHSILPPTPFSAQR